ncbi:MAG TPA: AMP-binding protein [Spirochaetota bacterium]|nr:AMP-binding protein [Spirochaetota bacterium]HPC43061.1 AMP-binding protein [Spirochaetota bacterium]HPL17286.1 AMP-binding protein [Spirochaetota bacterium]HQF06921.1 AMP-binding protein [Spirochaetota bacterium]HQH95460.1 AMP-binding protein [Spirochaetota bacterium]
MDFYKQVTRAGRSLIGLGVRKSDKFNVTSYTSYQWLLADQTTIVNTSGTTGVPTRAMTTHDNAIFTVQSVIMSSDPREVEETFLFLPIAHIYAGLLRDRQKIHRRAGIHQ